MSRRGLGPLLDGDAVARSCRAARLAAAAASALLSGALANRGRDVVLAFAAGWVLAALACEPALAAVECAILAYAERPRGLEAADAIVYRRFVRLAPRRRPARDDDVSL